MLDDKRNKENTKRKLIQAVATIIRSEGFSGLGVNKVAKTADVNKKLIYRYFGSFEMLVEAYVIETDYWMVFARQLVKVAEGNETPHIKEIINDILVNQFEYLRHNFELQQLLIWELSTDSKLMRSIHRTREMMGQQLLSLADESLPDSRVNFRAVAALLVGGIYYIILHTRHNGGMFSDLDVNSKEGIQDLKKAITFILDSAFTDANEKEAC